MKKLVLNKKILITAIASTLAIILLFTSAIWLLQPKPLADISKNFNTINIDATWNNQTKQLTAFQCIEYQNRTGESLNEIKFHIYANAYKDGAKNPPIANDEINRAYPNGKSFGGIEINNTTIDDKKVTHTIDGDDDTVLIVPLASPLEPNAKICIDMNYTVDLANIKHRLGWTQDTINLANFYPIPVVHSNGKWHTYPYSSNGDPFFNEMHNYNVTITHPQSMKLASSGTQDKCDKKDCNHTTHITSRAIRDFTMVLSDKFKMTQKTIDKVAVKYYYINDTDSNASLDISAKAIRTFSKLFAKYPYKTMSVVQTDFLHGGMEYGELVYVSTDFLNQTIPDREQHDYVIVHEIAHQWWYGIVGNNQSSTAWIDEGLAEYSTMLFYDAHPEYKIDRNVAIKNARDNYAAYIRLVRGLGQTPDTNMNRDLAMFSNSYEYVFMTYVRGLLLFVDLEVVLSKDKLISALRDYSNNIMFGIATQANLIQSIEKSTGAKVGLFFQTYLSGWNGFN